MSTITGTTYDKDGVALGSCECFLFKYDSGAGTLTQVGSYVTSDASTGVYTFTGIGDTDPTYMVTSFKDGSPNVFDVTDHNLTPV